MIAPALPVQRRPRASTRPAAPAPEPPAPLVPFTLPHFRAWAAGLTLDSDQRVVLEGFQDEVLTDIFAGVSEVWVIIPEGNGKTTLMALLALYHAEFRPFAAVPVAASSREQAEILYRQAEGFVLRSQQLHEMVESAIQIAKGKRKTDVPRFTCLEGYRRINHHGGGRIQVFAADDRTGDGLIPTLGLLDELHRHRDLALYRTWAGKILKRGGQIVAISTAGEPGSDFELTRERIRNQATDVRRDGFHTRYAAGRVVLHEWAVPETADVEDMVLVKAANPFTGVTIEALREKYASPTMTLHHWRRFVCNLPTRDSISAIQEGEWRAAIAAEPIPAGEPVWVGLDVAWKWDTTAAVPLWWRPDAHRQLGEARIVVPPRDGTSTNPELIKRELRDIHARNPIHTVVMDSSRAEDIAAWIEQELGCTVLDWPQANSVAAREYDRFMEGLRGGTLQHAGDAGLQQHALNAIAYMLPGGGTKFDRPSQTRISSESNRRVIDALKAAAMVNCAAVDNHAAAPVDAPVEFFAL